MSFDRLNAAFEQAEARFDQIEPSLEGRDAGPSPALRDLDREPGIELIRQLARQLALAHGEDPDEQPFPLRHPRWRFHCARAKVLLSISEAEHRALAAVLSESLGRTKSLGPYAGWARLWPARRTKTSP